MDIDMRTGRADQVTLAALIKDCATLKVETDGLTFSPTAWSPRNGHLRGSRQIAGGDID